MEITEIRIYPKDLAKDKKLKAFATITIDDSIVIRDIKIIEGKKGLFVAMPSTKVAFPCPSCKKKNPTTNRYCGNCGNNIENAARDLRAETRENHKDVAHPINSKTRDYLHSMVMEAYYKQKTDKLKYEGDEYESEFDEEDYEE